MKYINSTSPIHPLTDETVFHQADEQEMLAIARRLHFPILTLKHSVVGPDWSSNGEAEGDILHHIHLVISGSASVSHGNNTVLMRSGMAYWIPGNCPVHRKCSELYEIYYLTFRCEWFEGVDFLLDWPDRKAVELGPWDIQDCSQDWNSEFGLGAYLRLQARLLFWITRSVPDLHKIIKNHTDAHTQFEAAIRLMDENLRADLRMADIAAAQGISPSAFSMAFTRAFGLSPKSYLNRRINTAIIHRLLTSDEPIHQLADAFGFGDEYYFNRFFKKMNGVPPLRFRRRSFTNQV